MVLCNVTQSTQFLDEWFVQNCLSNQIDLNLKKCFVYWYVYHQKLITSCCCQVMILTSIGGFLNWDTLMHRTFKWVWCVKLSFKWVWLKPKIKCVLKFCWFSIEVLHSVYRSTTSFLRYVNFCLCKPSPHCS